MSPSSREKLLPAGYGAMHFVVDASTVTVVLSCGWLHSLTFAETFLLIVAYDVLAFASQTFIGLAVDRLRLLRSALFAGLALTALSILVLPLDPIVATALGATGNALFHVGAGGITLSVSRGRATPNGLFVAPGALGLGLGIYVGRNGLFVAWPFVAALIVSLAVAIVLTPRSDDSGAEARAPLPLALAPTSAPPRLPYLVLALLLASIAVRSLVGFAGAGQAPSGPMTALGLTLAAFGGKALGGIASDRLGWIRVSVGALLLSAPLIAFGAGDVRMIVAGMLLFQMTMPVTLTAIFMLYPRRPGFAFGIASTAFVLGVLPTFFDGAREYYSPALFCGLIAGSAAAIYAGLRLLGLAERVLPAALRRAA